ncbi:hypothetical protein C8Q77DRAFT_686239 [Trametes polyzona]|nr:hypothetical protein C8Q77DRAFT_686239 [Trametes polyzona]
MHACMHGRYPDEGRVANATPSAVGTQDVLLASCSASSPLSSCSSRPCPLLPVFVFSSGYPRPALPALPRFALGAPLLSFPTIRSFAVLVQLVPGACTLARLRSLLALPFSFPLSFRTRTRFASDPLIYPCAAAAFCAWFSRSNPNPPGDPQAWLPTGKSLSRSVFKRSRSLPYKLQQHTAKKKTARTLARACVLLYPLYPCAPTVVHGTLHTLLAVILGPRV